MFTMIDNPEFDTEATGKMPGDAGAPFTFCARFVALGSDERKTFDLATEQGTTDFLKRTLVGVGDVKDADGEPADFTAGTRDWLIDKAHTRAALVKAYFSGVYQGALGN